MWLWGECQVVLFWERLAIILVGEPRMAEGDSFASLWQVKGEDWQLFWREGQGWQSETVWQVFGRRLVNVLVVGPRVVEQDAW